MKKILSHISHFIFPQFCAHCEIPIHRGVFCENCLLLLQPISPEFRCSHCFSEIEEIKGLCSTCLRKPISYAQFASVFEREGPAEIFAFEMTRSFSPPIIKAAAGYMVYQLSQLPWEKPDLVTYFPKSLSEKIAKSFHPEAELAKRVSALLEVPIVKIVKERMTGLFSSKQVMPKKILGKKILLLSLEKKEVPVEGFSEKIYHLSFLDTPL